MIDRRRLLKGIPAAIFATVASSAHAEVGLSAGLDVLSAVQSLPGVTEGHGRGTLYILYAPWCSAVPGLYENTRGFLNEISFKWIPFSGGQPEGRTGVEALLSKGTTADIPRTFQTIVHGYTVKQSTPLSDAQDARMSEVARLIVRDTGRSMATPTLVYRLQGDRVRIHPGGLSHKGLLELSSYIA